MPKLRGAVVILGILVGCGSSAQPPPTAASPPKPAPAPPSADIESVPAVLGRFTFGPRPEDVRRGQELGARRWLEQQMAPREIAKCTARPLASEYSAALLPPLELARHFSRGELDPEEMRPGRLVRQVDFRRLIATAELAELARHVGSDCQVYEVMVDFWTNHFNVFARKGLVKLFAADFVERAIRPHALGRFEDLLIATAKHPAMLLYLDNAKSNARRGLNENYARELLELHTLGVSGGYTQSDVTEVARILTGFGVRRPREGELGFVFRERAHDRGDKRVLGKRYPGGRGETEGIELLRDLARHPSTATHLARKLCARFIADRPPPSCVERVAATYRDSGGDVRALLRSVMSLPELAAASGAKLKTPLEFLASALRVLAAEPDGTLGLARVLASLGEPILMMPVPTGYPDSAEAWTSGGALLARINTARALASARLPGARIDLDRVIPKTGDRDALLAAVNLRVLGGRGSPSTLDVIRREIAEIGDAAERRELAVALALSSPEFQKQ